ncbi:hypothetical protein A4X13_0g6594 [Tilletia indica]|uniref:Uncharacterized protein n=1 Tax=Tilletia indica TaxID=43049 RepID=A0A177TGP0_9BASI|nr:hypothetical protein A4X13_0g6594 [Tilletia indica]
MIHNKHGELSFALTSEGAQIVTESTYKARLWNALPADSTQGLSIHALKEAPSLTTRRILRSGSAPLRVTRLNQGYGSMPERDEIGRLAKYWMALINLIDKYKKARLLFIRSVRLRLRLVVHCFEQLRSSWWFASGCTVC